MMPIDETDELVHGSSAAVSAGRPNQDLPGGPTAAVVEERLAGATEAPTLLELGTVAVAMGLAILGGVSLLAAAAGVWSLPIVLGTSGILTVVVAWLLGRACGWAFARESRVVLVGAAAVAVAVLLLTLPGFRFGMTGWDPGVYQAHAQSIAESGELHRENPVVELGLEDVSDAHYPGLVRSTEDPAEVEFGFFHLFPALGAVAYAIGRTVGVALVNPLIGVVGLASLFLLLRRVTGGLAVATVTTGLAATSPIWLWHSQLPTSEMVAVTLLVAGALAASLGWRSRPLLLASGGFLVGMAATARADGLLILAAGAGAVAVLRYQRTDRSWLHLLAGLVPGGSLWALQAYETAADYARSHDVPVAWKAFVVVALPVAAAALLLTPRSPVRRWVDHVVGSRSLLLVRGVLLAYALVLVALFVRAAQAPAPDPQDPPSFAPHTIERLLVWLTPGGVVLVVVAALAVATSRRHHLTLLLLAPGLLVLPVYLIHPRIHPRFIWWTRRFLPMTWLPLLALMAIGAVWLWRGRDRWPRWLATSARVVAVAALAVVLVLNLQVVRAITSVQELEGSFAFSDRIITSVPRGSILLWEREPAFEAFGVSTMVRGDLDVVPVDPEDVSAAVDAVADEERPAYLLTAREPAPVDGLRRVQTVTALFEYLGHTYDRLPYETDYLPFTTTIYEVTDGRPLG